MRALTQAITIVERKAATANQLEIQSFTVDAVNHLITIAGRGVNVDDKGQTLGAERLPEVRVGGPDMDALMATGATNITVNVLTAMGLPASLLDQVRAFCAASPVMASRAYYDGTGDGLYDAVARALNVAAPS